MKDNLKQTNETIKISVENIQEDKYTISGMAVTLGEKSRNRIIYKDLSFEDKLPLLNEHDSAARIGYTNFERVGNVINFTSKLNPKNKLAMEVWESLKHGDVSTVSIGAYITEGSWNDDYSTFTVEKGELMELSVVSTPGFKDAKIKTIESIESNSIIKKEEVKKMEFKDMKHSELQEAFNEATKKLKETNLKIESLETKIGKSVDVDTSQELLEEKINEMALSESLQNEVNEMAHAIEMKNKTLEQIKIDNAKNNKKEVKENVMEFNASENVYLSTEKATRDFKKVLEKAVRKGDENVLEMWKSHLKTEGFTGDLSDLFPTTVIGDIKDCLEATGKLMPFLKQMYGVTGKLSFLINESEDLGYGWAGNSATKKEQDNVLTAITVELQYIYKYVTISRELLDQPGNVLYNYVINELSQRLIATIERAVLVGDGLVPSSPDKINSIVPMIETLAINSTIVDVVELDITTLDLLDDELIGNGRTIFAMNKRTYSALKNTVTTTGDRVYETGNVLINGMNYNTLDGNVIVENQFITPFNDVLAIDRPVIIAFKEMAYTIATTSEQAEMFMDFKLQTNTREFLTEINIGGNATECKSIAIAKKVVA